MLGKFWEMFPYTFYLYFCCCNKIFNVFHPKRRLYSSKLIFGMMRLQVLCGFDPKIQEFLPAPFFSFERGKWGLFTILTIWAKGVFHNLKLKTMKINNKVNFLKPYFFLTRNTPPNINIPCMQIEYKFAIYFQCSFINFRDNRYPQKQVNRNNSYFLL